MFSILDLYLRLSCMSATYCNADSRRKILETVAWSFQALSPFVYIWPSYSWKLPHHFTKCIHIMVKFQFQISTSICFSFNFHQHLSTQGKGEFPTHDPWGVPFSATYCKDRWMLGGQRLAGDYVACLEGIQGDLDYIRTMMMPARLFEKIQYCFLFDSFCKCFHKIPNQNKSKSKQKIKTKIGFPLKSLRILLETNVLLLVSSSGLDI